MGVILGNMSGFLVAVMFYHQLHPCDFTVQRHPQIGLFNNAQC